MLGELLGRVHANQVEAFAILGERALGGSVVRLGEATAVVTGMPSPEMNRLFLFGRETREVASVLQDAADLFEGLSWSVVTVRSHDPVLAAAVREAKLTFARTLPVMLFDGPAVVRSAVPGLDVHEADTQAEADLAVELIAEAFGAEAGPLRVFADEGVWRAPGTRLLVAWLDGDLAGTIALTVSHGVAGLANLAVSASARGRGVGEGLSWTAVGLGFEAGADAAALEATRAGFALYKRLGFRHAADHRVWYHLGG